MNHKSLVKALAREYPRLNPHKIDMLAHKVEDQIDQRFPGVRVSVVIRSTPFAPESGAFYTHFQLNIDGVTIYCRAEVRV